MINKELIWEMFNKMDDDFKQKHKNQIKNMLETYPCICLSKEDLIGYAENEYKESPEIIEKIVAHLQKLDSDDMQNMADHFSNDSIMDWYWVFIDYRLDLIKDELEN